MRRTLLVVLSLFMVVQQLSAQREKTSFQTLSEWKPTLDVRSDVVMVYGAGDYMSLSFHDRVNSWRDHGYTTHFMSGISWGGFDAYFKGEWDGKPHDDEVQRRLSGEGIMHGPNSPYVVPTHGFLEYFKENHIKRAIDEGLNTLKKVTARRSSASGKTTMASLGDHSMSQRRIPIYPTNSSIIFIVVPSMRLSPTPNNMGVSRGGRSDVLCRPILCSIMPNGASFRLNVR